MKNKTCSEFVRVLEEFIVHVRIIHGVELREVRADNDPCFTDNRSGATHNAEESVRNLRGLPSTQSIVFTHSAPEYQSLNPVECSVRQLYHLMSFYLQCGNLSSLCWMDMLMAATYVMNRLPHPQFKVMKLRVSSPYELVHHHKPDLSDMVEGPGELVMVDWIGTKASGGAQTGGHCHYIMPSGAGHLVHSFRTGKTRVSKSIRTLTSPDKTVQDMVSLRHTMQAGTFRDGSGLKGASAAEVASAGAFLLADAVRHGRSGNPNDYFLHLDPVSARPLRLVLVKQDGVLARVEVEYTK